MVLSGFLCIHLVSVCTHSVSTYICICLSHCVRGLHAHVCACVARHTYVVLQCVVQLYMYVVHEHVTNVLSLCLCLYLASPTKTSTLGVFCY